MQRNLRLRSKVAMAMREFLVHQHGEGRERERLGSSMAIVHGEDVDSYMH